MGRMSVSSCRCCMLVSRVHPVIVLSAWFCVVCSLVMFVSDVMGDHIVLAYSRMGLVIALYVVVSVSLDFPQCVDVSALSTLMVCFARFAVLFMWLVYVSLGSKVSPSIFGFLCVGSCVLFMFSVSVVEYSAGSGVNSVVVLLAFSVSWLLHVHSCISWR